MYEIYKILLFLNQLYSLYIGVSKHLGRGDCYIYEHILHF